MRIWKSLLVAAFASVVSLNACFGAGIRIADMPAESTPLGADQIVIVDASANNTDKVTLTNLFANVPAQLTVTGATPAVTIGDAGAEDSQLNFDGNAQDFSIGLEDATDKLKIGLGTTLGTTERMTFNSGDLGVIIGDNTHADVWMQVDVLDNDYVFGIDFSDGGRFEFGTGTALSDINEIMSFGTGTTNTEVVISDGDPLDAQIRFDGNAQDFTIGLDDSSDKFVIGLGGTLGTTQRLTFNSANLNILVGDATAADSAFIIDGNAQDYYIGLDDSADDLVFGVGSTLGTTQAIGIDEFRMVTFGSDTTTTGTSTVSGNFVLTGTSTMNGALVHGIVDLGVDITTPDVSTGTVFYVGSNTAATAITDFIGVTVGQIITIVTTGGANWTTIADSGKFNIAGDGGFVPDSADDSITFLVQADNDYVQIYGTQTNN